MRNAKLIVPALVVLGAALLIGVFTAVSMGGNHDKRVVKTAKVGGRTILVNRSGMTLYHLSVERKGHFICTDKTCLSLWKPLVVKRGTTPTGAKSLGTRQAPRRPAAGRVQGRPAVHVRRGQEARRHEGQRVQGRRHVARDRGRRQEPEHPDELRRLRRLQRRLLDGFTKRPAAAFSPIACSSPSTATR